MIELDFIKDPKDQEKVRSFIASYLEERQLDISVSDMVMPYYWDDTSVRMDGDFTVEQLQLVTATLQFIQSNSFIRHPDPSNDDARADK